MARRKRVSAPTKAEMPPELRHRPITAEEIDYWLAQPPLDVEGSLVLPDSQTAYRRWSHARHAWRTEHDESYWWYRRRVAG